MAPHQGGKVAHSSGRQNPFDPGRSQPRPSSLLGEFWYLLKTTKKWWMAPILLAIGILGLFVILGSSSVAPFIYSLF